MTKPRREGCYVLSRLHDTSTSIPEQGDYFNNVRFSILALGSGTTSIAQALTWYLILDHLNFFLPLNIYPYSSVFD